MRESLSLWPLPPAWSPLVGWLLAAAAFLSALAVLVRFVVPPARAAYAWSTRRRRLAERLRQLACGMQLDYFVHTLGAPAQYVTRLREKQLAEHVFVFDDAYVQAVVDQDGTVGLFAVTTRTRRFHPTLDYHPAGAVPAGTPIALGRTRFTDLDGGPQGVRGWVGARRFGYAESYYFGNPGHYQTYVFAVNDAGFRITDAVHHAMYPNLAIDWFPRPPSADPELGSTTLESTVAGPTAAIPQETTTQAVDRPEIRALRAATAINTYAVISSAMDFRLREHSGAGWWSLPVGIGPDADQVRTHPRKPARRLMWRRRR